MQRQSIDDIPEKVDEGFITKKRSKTEAVAFDEHMMRMISLRASTFTARHHTGCPKRYDRAWGRLGCEVSGGTHVILNLFTRGILHTSHGSSRSYRLRVDSFLRITCWNVLREKM